MNMWKMMGVVAFVCVLPLSIAYAGSGAQKLAAELGLSGDQKAKVSEIVSEAKIDAVDTKAKVKKARLELKQLLMTEPVDEKAAYKKLAEIDAALAELHQLKLATMLEIKAELTAEQWVKAVELRERGGDDGEGDGD